MGLWGDFMSNKIDKDSLIKYLESLMDKTNKTSFKTLNKTEKSMYRGSQLVLNEVVKTIKSGDLDLKE